MALGTISSAAILADRIARGDAWVVTATHAVAAAFVVAVLAVTGRSSFAALRADMGARADASRRPLGAVSVQAAGAVLGVVLVHLVLQHSALRSCQWLCERPPQLVNDLAATFGALALLWTCARQPIGGLSSLLAVGIAGVYALTASRWHLDAWGDALLRGSHRAISVQIAVLVQLVSTAVGVSVFYRLSATEERPRAVL
jgi:hypothetical protein